MKANTSATKEKWPEKGISSKEQLIIQIWQFLESTKHVNSRYELGYANLSESDLKACFSQPLEFLQALTQDQADNGKRVEDKTRQYISNPYVFPFTEMSTAVASFEDKTGAYRIRALFRPDRAILEAYDRISKNQAERKAEMIHSIPSMNDLAAQSDQTPASKVAVLQGLQNDDHTALVLKEPAGLSKVHFGPKNIESILLESVEVGDTYGKLLTRDNQPELKHFNLTFNKLTLVDALEKLKILSLDNNRLGDNGVQVIAKSKHLKFLEELHLQENEFGLEGAKHIGNADWRSLRLLDLKGNSIDYNGAYHLSRNTTWENLEILVLSHNSIEDKGVRYLRSNNTWKKLKELYLGDNKISKKGVSRLVENLTWKGLTVLSLEDNRIGDAGATLISLTPYECLRKINLSNNGIGDEGASNIEISLCWINIEEIDLSGNKISCVVASNIRDNKNWKCLKFLNLSNNNNEGDFKIPSSRIWTELDTSKLFLNQIPTDTIKLIGIPPDKWDELTKLNLPYQKNPINSARTKKQEEEFDFQHKPPSNGAENRNFTEVPNNYTTHDKAENVHGVCKISKNELKIFESDRKESEFEAKFNDIKCSSTSEEKSAEANSALKEKKLRTLSPLIEHDTRFVEFPKESGIFADLPGEAKDKRNLLMNKERQLDQLTKPSTVRAEYISTVVIPQKVDSYPGLSMTERNLPNLMQTETCVHNLLEKNSDNPSITQKKFINSLNISKTGTEGATKCTETFHNLIIEQNPSMALDEQKNRLKVPPTASLNETLENSSSTSTVSSTGNSFGLERQIDQSKTAISLSKAGIFTSKTGKQSANYTDFTEKSHEEQKLLISKVKQRERCNEKLSPRVQGSDSHITQIDTYNRGNFSTNRIINIQDLKTEMVPPFQNLRIKCEFFEYLQLQLQRSENVNMNFVMTSNGSRRNYKKSPFLQGITTKSPEWKKFSLYLRVNGREQKCFASFCFPELEENLNSPHRMIQFIQSDAVRIFTKLSFLHVEPVLNLPWNTYHLPLSEFTDYFVIQRQRSLIIIIKSFQPLGICDHMNQISYIILKRPNLSSIKLGIEGISPYTPFQFSKRKRIELLMCQIHFFVFIDKKGRDYHYVDISLFSSEKNLTSPITDSFLQIAEVKKAERKDSYKSKKGLHFIDSPLMLKQNQIKWLIALFNKVIEPWDYFRRGLTEKILQKLCREKQYPFKPLHSDDVEELPKKELLERQRFLTAISRVFLLKATSQKLAFNIQEILIDRIGKQLCKYQSPRGEKAGLIGWLIAKNMAIREGYNERVPTYVLISYFFELNSIQDALFFCQILLHLKVPGVLDYYAATEESVQGRIATNEDKNVDAILLNQWVLARIVHTNFIQILIEEHLIFQSVISQVRLWDLLQNIIDRLFDEGVNVYQDAYSVNEIPEIQLNLLQSIINQSLYSLNDENNSQYVAPRDHYPLDIAEDNSMDLGDIEQDYEVPGAFQYTDDEDLNEPRTFLDEFQNVRTNLAQKEAPRAGSVERHLDLAANMQGINSIENGGLNIEEDINNRLVQADHFHCYSGSMNDNFNVPWDDAAIRQMCQNQCASNSFHNVEEAVGYQMADNPLEQIILVDFINGNQHESTRILQEYQPCQDSLARIGIYDRIKYGHNQSSEDALGTKSILDEYQLYQNGLVRIGICENIQNEQD